MTYGIRLHVWGERACFTRPEMKVERVSYDCITPSAARGILEAIHWKPAIRWVVERITVLNPISFESIRRNEIGQKASASLANRAMTAGGRTEVFIEDSRAQRTSLILRDVAYVIDARFEMTDRAGAEDNPAKHLEMFTRRARKGQCFHQPCLGCREFPAHFSLLEGNAEPQPWPQFREKESTPHPSLVGERELGWMLNDIDFANGRQPLFFRAVMRDGVIEVPPLSIGGGAVR